MAKTYKVPRVCALCKLHMGTKDFKYKPKPGTVTHGYCKPCAEAIMKGVQVYFDPDYVDAYTVIIGDDVFTMSENAMSPNGFNQYAGKLDELRGARKGKKVDLVDIPKQVAEAIRERAKVYVEENPQYRIGDLLGPGNLRRSEKDMAAAAVYYMITAAEETPAEDLPYIYGGKKALVQDLKNALRIVEKSK